MGYENNLFLILVQKVSFFVSLGIFITFSSSSSRLLIAFSAADSPASINLSVLSNADQCKLSCFGFITKSAPQLNLFSFGFPLTILGTFFALYFSVDALQYVFSGLIDEAIGYVKSILNGGGSDG